MQTLMIRATPAGTHVILTHEHLPQSDIFHVTCEGCPYRHDVICLDHRPGYDQRVKVELTAVTASAIQHAETCQGGTR